MNSSYGIGWGFSSGPVIVMLMAVWTGLIIVWTVTMDDVLVSMLYDILGVSVIEGERLEVLGATAGPAGSSAIDLPSGGTWEVDHLDPAIPVRFEVELRGADRSPLLIAAFGGDGALYLADQAVEHRSELRSDWESAAEVVPTAPDPLLRRPNRQDFLRRRAGRVADDPDLMAGRIVVLNDLASDTRSDPLARVAAMTELLLRAYAVSGGELLMPARPGIVEMAATLAAEVDDDQLNALGTHTIARLASMLTRVGGTGRGSGSPLVGLAERARSISLLRTPSMAAVAARHPGVVSLADLPDPEPSEPDTPNGDPTDGKGPHDGEGVPPVVLAMRLPSAVQVSSDDLGSAAEFLDLQRLGSAHVRVSVTRDDRERWVRLTHARSHLPLAQAALRRRDLLEVADLVVPPGLTDDDLVIELVDPTDPTFRDARAMHVIHGAVRQGRVAARRTRVHGAASARAEWDRCADMWAMVGDPGREGMARALAEGEAAPPIEPYLADHVTEALTASS